MRHLLLVAVMAVGCGSVESKQMDARPADTSMGSGSDAGSDAAATCAPTPSMAKARYRAESNANDHLGNFNGATVGASFSYAAGKYGQAFQLDGVDDTVTINDGEQMWPSGSLTLEAWIKTTATRPSNIIVCKYSCGNQCATGISTAYWCLYTNAAGKPAMDFQPDQPTSGTTAIVASLVTVNDGAWHHIVGVRDATAKTASVYVDGALATTASPAAGEFGPMTNADNDVDLVTIGSNVIGGQTGYEALFTGAIDEVAIYHSALTAAQVSAIYAAPDGKCL
jgi:hypothetical protein